MPGFMNPAKTYRIVDMQMISDSLPVLVQEIVQWDVEYRCFISEKVRQSCLILLAAHGKRSPRDENGIWSANELPEAIEFCNSFLSDPNVCVPDACVIDVGVIPARGWAVIECNAAWSSGIYGCDGAAVLPVLLRACRPVTNGRA